MKPVLPAAAALGAVLCLLPTAASANLIWPAALLEARLLSAPVIAAGLLIEIAVLRFGFRLGWARAALAATAVNAISAAIGLIAIPLLGIVWEIFPGILIHRALNVGTFNPVTWAATFAIAALVTALIEALALRWIFRLPWTCARSAIWLLANAVTVALAFLSFFVTPLDTMQPYDPWLFG